MEVFYPEKKTFEGVLLSEREEIVGDKLYGAINFYRRSERKNEWESLGGMGLRKSGEGSGHTSYRGT